TPLRWAIDCTCSSNRPSAMLSAGDRRAADCRCLLRVAIVKLFNQFLRAASPFVRGFLLIGRAIVWLRRLLFGRLRVEIRVVGAHAGSTEHFACLAKSL